MEIIFVRHGESQGNSMRDTDSVFSGQTDWDLTERGYQQAAALSGDPVFEDADAYYCSDLKRAVETAEAIIRRSWTRDARLRERSMGEFEGRKVEEVKADPRYEKYFTDPRYQTFRHSFTVKVPGGENYADVCRRVRPFLEELMQSGARKAVVVAHFVTIRCMLKELRGLSEEETLSLFIPNCSPMRIVCAEPQRRSREPLSEGRP